VLAQSDAVYPPYDDTSRPVEDTRQLNGQHGADLQLLRYDENYTVLPEPEEDRLPRAEVRFDGNPDDRPRALALPRRDGNGVRVKPWETAIEFEHGGTSSVAAVKA
jgi:hypothetical protein